MIAPIRLTEMVKCAGCAAKLGPAQLSRAVKGLCDDLPADPNVLVGFGTLDDAGVYRISDRQALVQTIDFVTPLVDDPYTYGAIAVTNALSDVYAMGGRPVSALNVVCFPGDGDPEILRQILRGGLDKLTEAGAALLGGHSVDDSEIKFGAAVTGLIDPHFVLTNAGARPGDKLILTKPLGAGIITTAIKLGEAPAEAVDAAIGSMTALNRTASECVLEAGANACTDVTGFSLIGHLHHMATAAGVSARIDATQLPALPHALRLARLGIYPGGTDRNRAHFGNAVDLPDGIEDGLVRLLFDPQTSGGLLISVPDSRFAKLVELLNRSGVPAAIIGEIIAQGKSPIQVLA